MTPTLTSDEVSELISALRHLRDLIRQEKQRDNLLCLAAEFSGNKTTFNNYRRETRGYALTLIGTFVSKREALRGYSMPADLENYDVWNYDCE